jgi:hypothetical protein
VSTGKKNFVPNFFSLIKSGLPLLSEPSVPHAASEPACRAILPRHSFPAAPGLPDRKDLGPRPSCHSQPPVLHSALLTALALLAKAIDEGGSTPGQSGSDHSTTPLHLVLYLKNAANPCKQGFVVRCTLDYPRRGKKTFGVQAGSTLDPRPSRRTLNHQLSVHQPFWDGHGDALGRLLGRIKCG